MKSWVQMGRRERLVGLGPGGRVTGLLALALCAVLAGCGVSAQSAPRRLNPKDVPYGLLSQSASPSTSLPGMATARVTIYMENGDGRLVPVHRDVRWPASLSAILGQLAAGPTDAESSQGLVSPASSIGPFHVGVVSDGVVSVRMPKGFQSLSGLDQQLAAAQIVFTVTTFTGITGVRFLVDGQVARVPSGNGRLTRGTSTRQDFRGLEA